MIRFKLQALFGSDGQVLPNGIILTCGSDQNFTEIPTSWPTNCTEIPEKCQIPATENFDFASKNFESSPVETETEYSYGQILTYNCVENHQLEGDA